MGVGGAAGRLVELGERQRGAQCEAARALPLRDRDGRQEGFLGGRGVAPGRASAGFRHAPDAVPLRTRDSPGGPQSPALRRGSRRRDRNRPPGPRPRPARSSTARRTTERSVRAEVLRRGACPRARRRARRRAMSPNPQKHAERAPHGQVMLAREADEFECVRRGARLVATHQFEHGRVHLPKRERAGMSEAPRSASACGRRAKSRASTSPRGHDVIAKIEPLR